jgi:hypothetical protein
MVSINVSLSAYDLTYVFRLQGSQTRRATQVCPGVRTMLFAGCSGHVREGFRFTMVRTGTASIL